MTEILTQTLLLADAALRGAAMAVPVLSAGAVLAARPTARLGWALAALSLSLVAYLAASAPAGPWLPVPVLFLPAALGPVLVWWAALELFDEADALWRLVPLIGAVLAVLAWYAGTSQLVAGLRGALALALYAHVLVIAWRGDAGDLLAARRGLRRAILALGASVGLAITLVELVLGDAPPAPWAFPLQSGSLLVVSVAFGLWLLRVAPGILPEPPPDPVRAAAGLADAEQAVLMRLDKAMAEGAWRQEGLAIGALARQIGTAEHRLRRVINRGLGHRNFAAFVNGYRIRAACDALSDASQADRTVLEIAYDSGFASLGPFNRAFREITGEAPTAFRARLIRDGSGPKPE